MKKIFLLALLGTLQTRAQQQPPYKYAVGANAFSWISIYQSYTHEDFKRNLRDANSFPIESDTVWGSAGATFNPGFSIQLDKTLGYKPGRYLRSMNVSLGFIFGDMMHYDGNNPSNYNSVTEYENIDYDYYKTQNEVFLSYGQELRTDRKEINYYGGLTLIISQSYNSTGSARITTSGYNSGQGYYTNSQFYPDLKMKNFTSVSLVSTFGIELLFEKNVRLRFELRPGYGKEWTHKGSTLVKWQLPVGIGLSYGLKGGA